MANVTNMPYRVFPSTIHNRKVIEEQQILG